MPNPLQKAIFTSSAFRLADANPILRSQAAVLGQDVVPDAQRPSPSLPFADLQEGDVFQDKDDPNKSWYLPTFTLAENPDPLFSFAASRSGIDAQGNPFNRATLRFGLSKSVPVGVETGRALAPGRQYHEIPLRDLAVTLTVLAKDPQTGTDTPVVLPCAVTPINETTWQVTIDNVLGVNVLLLYDNLVNSGTAMLSLAAAYDVWRSRTIGRPLIFWARWPHRVAVEEPVRRPVPLEAVQPVRMSNPATSERMLRLNTELTQPGLARIRAESVDNGTQIVSGAHDTQVRVDDLRVAASGTQRLVVRPDLDRDVIVARADRRLPIMEGVPRPGDPGPVPVIEQATFHFSVGAQLGRKFATDLYRLKLTIDRGDGPRPIVDISDLNSFNTIQSEYIELTALGDISSKYPSIRQLYLGVLSRTIVVIPQRYVIVRDRGSCAAVCRALVDSSPGRTSSCKFQFEFLLAPDISPVEYLQLSQEIAANPDLKGCTLTPPDLIAETQAPVLGSPFVTSFRYSNGPTSNTVVLSVEVRDDTQGSLAVANANLFIRQLRAAHEPYLSGSFDVKLDQSHSTIDATVLLSFRDTIGLGALEFRIDEAAQAIHLVNESPFPLRLSRYALGLASGIIVQNLSRELASGESTLVPLPADHAGMGVLVDYEIAIGDSIGTIEVARYLEFQSQDVQNAQYVLGINAAAVNFEGRAIESIQAQISIANLAQVTVPDLSLHKLRKMDSTNVLVPLQYAMTQLSATVLFMVKFVDPQRSPVKFTKTCDFIETPILILQDRDLPAG
ncbi:hypothetical protein [Microvirga massiliensis]|uniref:hypothetical protein n=1 Tax=Microvirga massiliensis TaxID=1033741 RepID=UPI00062B757A|nr:hypothetical protein [Microvirga massiliensis]